MDELEMEMRKVDIVGYFVNRRYNRTILFEDWLDNVMAHYLVDADRTIHIFTDNADLQRYSGGLVDINILHGDFGNIGQNRLMKISILKDASSLYPDGNFISFFQSNLRCKKDVTVASIINDGFDLSCPLHPELSTYGFVKLFHPEFAIPIGRSVTDISGIDCSNMNYFQNGHIIGKTRQFNLLMNELWKMIEEDRSRGVKIIGQPHDERYFNYYLNIENTLCIKVKALDNIVFNNRDISDDRCYIYQIDKNKSNFFS